MPNKIKDLRIRAKEKQIDLAKYLEVTQATLSNWERGVHDPDNEVLIKLADKYNVSVDYILGRTDSNDYPMNNIKKIRTSRGLSQQDLATAVNVHQTSVSQWETGRTNPDTAQAILLADYFDVTTDYLLGRTNDPTPSLMMPQTFQDVPMAPLYDPNEKAQKKEAPATFEEVEEAYIKMLAAEKGVKIEDLVLSDEDKKELRGAILAMIRGYGK